MGVFPRVIDCGAENVSAVFSYCDSFQEQINPSFPDLFYWFDFYHFKTTYHTLIHSFVRSYFQFLAILINYLSELLNYKVNKQLSSVNAWNKIVFESLIYVTEGRPENGIRKRTYVEPSKVSSKNRKRVSYKGSRVNI